MKKRVFSGWLIITILMFTQGCFNGAFYQPNQTWYKYPSDDSLCFEDIYFNSKDGTRLHGCLISAGSPVLGTVVYLHGNFGNLSYYFNQIGWLPAEGFNVFIFDYRGYGRSEGVANRRGIYEDSVAAIEYILTKPGIDSNNVFVFGQSFGGTQAMVALAKNNFKKVRAAVIEGAFGSYRRQALDSMAATTRKKFGNIPGLLLHLWPISFFVVTDTYSPMDSVQALSPLPVIWIHGLQDTTVPWHHGWRLYQKAREPKELWLIPEGGHLTTFVESPSAAQYRRKLIQFFKDHCSLDG